MGELKTIKMSDIPTLSEAELKVLNAKQRGEYLQTLRDLCPSKDMRNEAKHISKRKNSCETCVYCDGESGICWYPKSDAVMEALNIDPCYEGVLRFMVKKAETQAQKETEYIDEETAVLSETIRILSVIFLDWIDNGIKPPEFVIQAVRELREHTENTVIPLYQILVGDIENL